MTAINTDKKNSNNLIDPLKGMFAEDKLGIFNNDAEKLAQKHPSPLAVKSAERAPCFSLPNADGKTINLQDLLVQGPVVLNFYRGAWCPYCNLHLKLLQDILPQIKQAGASLLAISPMTPDNSKASIENAELQYEVLSDASNKVARQFTRVFRNADEPIQAMADLGYDFYSFYDDRSAELPVSATFIISPEGIVTFAESEGGDYRKRIQPAAILSALNI